MMYILYISIFSNPQIHLFWKHLVIGLSTHHKKRKVNQRLGRSHTRDTGHLDTGTVDTAVRWPTLEALRPSWQLLFQVAMP